MKPYQTTLKNIRAPYECPHCHTIVPKGGTLTVVNADTPCERRYCSPRCRFEGRPTFTIYICKVSFLRYCAEGMAAYNSGRYWMHDPDRCEGCVRTPKGWELWGENGHMQGRVNEYPDEHWRHHYGLRHGDMTRILFKDGHAQSYLA